MPAITVMPEAGITNREITGMTMMSAVASKASPHHITDGWRQTFNGFRLSR